MKVRAMNPFRRAHLPPEVFDVSYIAKRYSVSIEEATRVVEHNKREAVWMNNLYQVNITTMQPLLEQYPPMVHLSIKRRDKQPIHDWRHLQQIKNELVGPEHEGVEIYPAESRKVDSANQYHLWVFDDPNMRCPFGFDERLVTGPDEAAAIGAKQRPFAEPNDEPHAAQHREGSR